LLEAHRVLRDEERVPITHLVNLACCDPACRYEPGSRTVLALDQGDGEPIPRELLDTYFAWMRGLSPADAVLVHCFAGISRGPTFAIAWLMYRDLQAHPWKVPSSAWDRAAEQVAVIRPQLYPAVELRQSVLTYFGEPSLL
jgi:hypothetical protein